MVKFQQNDDKKHEVKNQQKPAVSKEQIKTKQSKQSHQNVQKRKIIKKFPFKPSSSDKKQDDNLKDWKPTKIQKKDGKSAQKLIRQQDVALAFLGSLSKPVNKTTQRRSFFMDDDEVIRIPPKPVVNMSKPTAEQIKWDIQDQTFIQKQFIPKKQVEHAIQQNPNQAQEQAQQIIIKGKQKQYKTAKMKHIDLSKVVNKNWQQAAQNANAKNELWESAQGLLEGHGSLSKLAKQAQSKAHQIQDQMNKKSYEKKQMKSRYGW